jgi:hypothetical protein
MLEGLNMHTKTLVDKTDWLSEIDGRTVAFAIEYLKGLNKDYILNAYLDGGDTHGVEMASHLEYSVPMTDAEILVGLENVHAKQLAGYERSRLYYIDRNQLDRLPAVDKLIDDATSRIEEARKKYGPVAG